MISPRLPAQPRLAAVAYGKFADAFADALADASADESADIRGGIHRCGTAAICNNRPMPGRSQPARIPSR
jgi:hypothetical protein